MAQCVFDFGIFKHVSEKGVQPTESDYILHFSLALLRETCLHPEIPQIIPRMLLNNIAIKLSMNQIDFVTPRHQNWAMEIFAAVKSDLVPDFMNKMKINHMITPEILLNITKGQMD